MSQQFEPQYPESNKPVHPLESKPAPPPTAPTKPGPPPPKVIFKQTTPTLTYSILVLNIVIYLLNVYVFKGALLELGAKSNAAIASGEFWRLITPMFLHLNFDHIAANSFGLFILGRHVERDYGHLRFAAIYFLSGVAGCVASFAFSQNDSVGASGAITGLLGAMIPLLYHNRKLFTNTKYLVPWVTEMVLGTLLSAFARGVDYWGHYGGLAGGVVLSWFAAPMYKVSRDLDSTIRVEDGSNRQSGWLVMVMVSVALVGATVAVIWLRANGLMP